MSCPKCNVAMAKKTVTVSKDIDLVCLQCPQCKGIWIEKPQVDLMKEQIRAKIRRAFWAGKE